jgi:outer membrane protein OmpA-like peptidoglycan-associated protein
MKVTAAGFNDAFAETPVTVLEYRPPSGTLQVSPTEIWVGEKATLSANFNPGQCGGALKPATLSASEGTLSGVNYDSSGIQFDPSNNSEQRKTITIAANVADDKSSASAEASLVVKKKAAIMAKRLPDIVFPTGSERINNCGKRVLLEELKTTLDNEPGGKVVFVGHQTENEAKWPGLDQKRALNAAAVISAGQGICAAFPASQIFVSAEGAAQNGVDPQPHFCAASAGAEKPGQGVSESDDAAKYRRVEVWFVPTGGVLPPLLKDHKDAATLSVTALGCPR